MSSPTSSVRRLALRALAPLAVATALPVAPLTAQVLQGIVRLEESGDPATGLILAASRTADDSVVARTLTGARGNYLLTLPANTAVRLRALRVGHRPTELGIHTLAAGERKELDFVIAPSPVVLAEVRQEEADRCRIPREAGAQVVALHDEVVKALTAAQLSRANGRPVVEYATSRRMLDRRGTPLGPPTRRVSRGTSARPFQSIPAESLAVVGYVSEVDGSVVYRAPDADVLLSPAFYESHCLQVARADSVHPEWVGLEFRPNGARPVPIDIAGVLWIDRPSAQLRRLEYRYVGFPRGSALESANLGGSIDFTVLADGWWFEDSWEIRMPRTTVRRAEPGFMGRGGQTATTVGIESIETVGGEVLSLSRGTSVLYVGGSRAFGVAAPPDETRATLECGVDPASGEMTAMVHGLVTEGRSHRATSGQVTVTWREDFVPLPNHEFRWSERSLTTTVDAGLYALCGAPRKRLLSVQANRGTLSSQEVRLRISEESDAARVDLTLDRQRRERP